MDVAHRYSYGWGRNDSMQGMYFAPKFDVCLFEWRVALSRLLGNRLGRCRYRWDAAGCVFFANTPCSRYMNASTPTTNYLAIPPYPCPTTRGSGKRLYHDISLIFWKLCRTYPGIGVVLRRICAGTATFPMTMRKHQTARRVLSFQTGLDCTRSALLDSVHVARNIYEDSVVRLLVRSFHSKLKEIGGLLDSLTSKGVHCRLGKIAIDTDDAIHYMDKTYAFYWHANTERGQVFIIQLQTRSGSDHAVAIDTSSCLLYDGCNQVSVRSTVESLFGICRSLAMYTVNRRR